MTWRPPETAPKDGTPILALFTGYPWGVACLWNEVDKEWVYALAQANLFHGEWNDNYFENERAAEHELRAWMPIPEAIK
jgi:hypothetical protein